MADELPRRGAQLNIANVEQIVKCPIQYIKTSIDTRAISRHNQQWQSSTQFSVSRSIWPTLDKKRTQYLLSLDKSSLRVLVGVITGHCQVGSFQSRFSPNFSDECRSCMAIDSIENIFHFLCETSFGAIFSMIYRN